MRLANQLSRFYRLPQGSCRHSSSSSGPTYSLSHLRAFPFVVSPEQAIVQLGPFASAISLFKDILGSIGARYLPGFGFTPFLPTRIQPVYYPGWVVDVEAEIEVTSGEDKSITTGRAFDSYLPGSHYPVLSNVCLLPKEQTTTLSWSRDLLSQHDMDILCIPYSISPFSIPHIAKNTWRRISVDDNKTISPSTFRPTFLAAYPVLIPLYIAQYEYQSFFGKGQTHTLTLVIEASKPKGRILSENVAAQHRRTLDEVGIHSPSINSLSDTIREYNGGVDVQWIGGIPTDYIQIAGAKIVGLSSGFPGAVTSWANDILKQPETLDELLAHSDVSKLERDPRVRPLLSDERETNHLFMRLGSEIELTKQIHQVLSSVESDGGTVKPVHVVNVSRGRIHTDRERVDSKALSSRIDELKARRDEVMPSWWRKWQRMQNSGNGKI